MRLLSRLVSPGVLVCSSLQSPQTTRCRCPEQPRRTGTLREVLRLHSQTRSAQDDGTLRDRRFSSRFLSLARCCAAPPRQTLRCSSADSQNAAAAGAFVGNAPAKFLPPGFRCCFPAAGDGRRMWRGDVPPSAFPASPGCLDPSSCVGYRAPFESRCRHSPAQPRPLHRRGHRFPACAEPPAGPHHRHRRRFNRRQPQCLDGFGRGSVPKGSERHPKLPSAGKSRPARTSSSSPGPASGSPSIVPSPWRMIVITWPS